MNILYLTLAVLIAWVFFGLGWYLSYKINFKSKNRIPTQGNNIKPEYYGYKGGFDRVTKCDNCDLVGLYEDHHVTKPCFRCGGHVEWHASAKWVNNEWIKI